jgi:hypothetical protein
MRGVFTIALVLTLLPRTQAQADIQIFTPSMEPQILAAMEHTASIWEQHLNSPVQIKVNVLLFPVSGAFLGFTFPNGRRNFAGAPLADTWYPTCLANAMTGMELNPGESDIDIVMAADANWYFGTDGNPGSQQFDFVSVLLHEIGHGLGFVSLSDSYGGEGSFGMIDFSQFAPFQPTFPIPQLDGMPGAYDRLLATGTGQALTDTSLFPSPSPMLHATFTGNNVFFSGEESTIANDGQDVKIFAPPVFAFGTSISHLDEGSFPNAGGNSLMTPYINKGEVEHHPGPITLGVLRDIGWNISTAVAEIPVLSGFSARILGFGNESVLQLELPAAGEVRWALADARGQVLRQVHLDKVPEGRQHISLGNELSGLPAGFYIVQAVWEGQVIARQLVLAR